MKIVRLPEVRLDVDATEFAEMPQFLTSWLTHDLGCIGTSLKQFVANPAYGIVQLRGDLEQFVFCSAEPRPGPVWRHGGRMTAVSQNPSWHPSEDDRDWDAPFPNVIVLAPDYMAPFRCGARVRGKSPGSSPSSRPAAGPARRLAAILRPQLPPRHRLAMGWRPAPLGPQRRRPGSRRASSARHPGRTRRGPVAAEGKHLGVSTIKEADPRQRSAENARRDGGGLEP